MFHIFQNGDFPHIVLDWHLSITWIFWCHCTWFLIPIFKFPLLLYKDTVDFFILSVSCNLELQQELIGSKTFFGDSLIFSICKIKLSVNRQICMYSYVIHILYIHFSYLNALARTFHLILIRSSKNRHLCLVLTLSEKHPVFHR